MALALCGSTTGGYKSYLESLHADSDNTATTRIIILPYKAKRQYLLALQVSRYYLVAVHDSVV